MEKLTPQNSTDQSPAPAKATISLRADLLKQCDQLPYSRRVHFLESTVAPGNKNLVGTVNLRPYKTEPHGILLEHCVNTLPAALDRIVLVIRELEAEPKKSPAREKAIADLKEIVHFGDTVTVRAAFKDLLTGTTATTSPIVPRGTMDKKQEIKPAFDPFKNDSDLVLERYADGYLISSRSRRAAQKPHLSGSEGGWQTAPINAVPFSNLDKATTAMLNMAKTTAKTA